MTPLEERLIRIILKYKLREDDENVLKDCMILVREVELLAKSVSAYQQDADNKEEI